MAIETLNPATGVLVKTFPEMEAPEVDRILTAAVAAQRAWARSAFAERAAPMRAVAKLLRERAPEYAKLMALEMGKPLKDGAAEVTKCAWVCEYCAETAERDLTPREEASDAGRSYVRFDPLGVVLAVMPWNFPFWQVFRFIAPHLMAGNGGLLKHASNVPQCALAIEQVMHDAGFPRDLFRTLLVGARGVRRLILDDRIAAVTITGSEPAGRQVAAAAVYDAFLEKLTTAMKAVRVGDPADPATDIGPQARRELRDELHGQVKQAIAQGARPVLGCEVPAGAGAFYPASILADVGPGNVAAKEELFGPVAAVMRARDADDAVAIANDSRFGLGASLWTGDPAKIERLVPRIEAGAVFVNGMVKSDPRLPFGGVKCSGYGRELGVEGIRSFVNVKTVWVK
jgi:succinate-semialdehyde dehydrogenase / glutarate-semialdehyde dehydrogenase